MYNPHEGVTAGRARVQGLRAGLRGRPDAQGPRAAQDVAAIAGLETPLGALAHQLYSAHQAAGNGGRDFSSIIQALRDRSPA